MRYIDVSTSDKHYKIEIDQGFVWSRLATVLQDYSKAFLLIDGAIEQHYQADIQHLCETSHVECQQIVLGQGEAQKSIDHYSTLAERILSIGLDRKSVIVAIGGGVTGDLAGFLAATLLRGVGFIQVPTTLLAQTDSSVGGKVAVNMKAGKNLLGAFYQPDYVFIELDFFKTLPKRAMVAGYGEVLKYGLMRDRGFFDDLNNGLAKDMFALDKQALIKAIAVSCQIKADIVSADEKEADKRALLNLGHTFGHVFEALCDYDGRIEHGEAVLIGMAMAARFSVDEGLMHTEEYQEIAHHYQALGLPLHWHDHFKDVSDAPDFKAESFLKKMYKDKKTTNGQITLILMRGIGEAFIQKDSDAERLKAFLIKDL